MVAARGRAWGWGNKWVKVLKRYQLLVIRYMSSGEHDYMVTRVNKTASHICKLLREILEVLITRKTFL